MLHVSHTEKWFYSVINKLVAFNKKAKKKKIQKWPQLDADSH